MIILLLLSEKKKSDVITILLLKYKDEKPTFCIALVMNIKKAIS